MGNETGDDLGKIADEVVRDIAEGMGKLFESGDGAVVPAKFNAERGPLSNGAFASVGWIFSGRDTIGIWGRAPSNRHVEIRGMTVVDLTGGSDDRFFRYIDWLDVAAQLGLAVGGRVPVDPPGDFPPENGGPVG